MWRLRDSAARLCGVIMCGVGIRIPLVCMCCIGMVKAQGAEVLRPQMEMELTHSTWSWHWFKPRVTTAHRTLCRDRCSGFH